MSVQADEISSILKEKVQAFLELLNRFKRYLKTYSLTNLVIKLYDETGSFIAGTRVEGEKVYVKPECYIQTCSNCSYSCGNDDYESIVALLEANGYERYMDCEKYYNAVKNDQDFSGAPLTITVSTPVAKACEQ